MAQTAANNFGGPDLPQHLLSAVESAKGRVWLVVPWWHHQERPYPAALLTTITDAVKRGADVRVMLRNDGDNTWTIEALRKAGVQVRPLRYVHYKELHVDGRVVSFSANFTSLELERNQNVAYDIDGADREAAEAAFVSLWGTASAAAAAGEEVWTPATDVVPDDIAPLLGRTTLNPLQAKALPLVFGSPDHLLVVAPTGAGKTDIGEAAALKAIKVDGRRAVYITPARALTGELSERFRRWAAHGVRIVQLTGEEDADLTTIRQADLWVATTEKFESLCRRASLQQAVAEVGCIVVDEIHFVGNPERGATLEALLARLRLLADQTRIVGLSATVANAEDLAGWLGAKLIESSWRPVQLSIQVVPYDEGRTANETHDVKHRLIRSISDDVTGSGGQVLVFCGSKPNVHRTAAHLAHLSNADLQDGEALAAACRQGGVGLHYRGLLSAKTAEQAFRKRETQVLVATSGLAQGVNLPARAVIVRDIELGQTPLATGDALQMLGRAGRHGQETDGYGFLLVPQRHLASWRIALSEGQAVHSRILGSLADHILADILLGRIGTVADLQDWFAGTFAAYQGRAGNAPLDAALDLLGEGGFIVTSGVDQALSCTPLGMLTSRFLVEAPSAHAILTTLRSVGVDSAGSPEAAEAAILRTVAAAVPAFADAGCPPHLTAQLDALLASTEHRDHLTALSPGARKTLLAAHVAITDPDQLRPRAPLIGPFKPTDLADLAAGLPRYLSWLGALGMATTLDWPVPVAADLAARIEWRRCRPPRGAGRLLRFLADMVPVTDRHDRVPYLYARAMSRHMYAPEAFTAKPQAQPMTDADWERLKNSRFETKVTDVTASGTELAITATAPVSADLMASAAAHAGAAATVGRALNWGGTPLRAPLPPGATAGKVAVDFAVFGRSDWAYSGGTWPVEVSTDVATRRLRQLIDELPATAIATSGPSLLSRTFGNAEHRLRRRLAVLLGTPQPHLAPLARHLAGTGEFNERAYQLRDSMLTLLTLGSNNGLPRSPVDILRSGHATSAEAAITQACLLLSLEHEAGICLNGEADAVTVLHSPEGWTCLPLPGQSISEVKPVTPKRLPPLLHALRAPTPRPPATVEPRLSLLARYRQIDPDEVSP